MIRFAQAALVAGVAFVVGAVVGGWQPRTDARYWKDRAENAPATCEDDGGEATRRIAQVFGGRPLDDRIPGTVDEDDRTEGADAEPKGEGEGPAEVTAPQDPEEAVRVAKEAVRLRRAQARAALAEAGVSDAELATIDGALVKMNDDLQALADEFSARVEEEGAEPERRELMSFAADVLDVVVAADDALYEAVPPEVRQDLDPTALDPFSYLDEDVVESVVRIRTQ